MKISKKISLTSLAFSTAITILTIVSLYLSSVSNDRLSYFQSSAMPSIVSLDDSRMGVSELMLLYWRHLETEDFDEKSQMEQKINNQIASLKKIQEERRKILTGQALDNTNKAIDMLDKIEKTNVVFFDLSRNVDIEEKQNQARAILNRDDGLGGIIRNLYKNFDERRFNYINKIDALSKENVSTYDMTFWSMLFCSCIIIFILSAISFKTTQQISKKLNAMSNSITEASQNLDLSITLDDSGDDEIGDAARAYNHLIHKIVDSLIDVRNASHSVHLASGEISAGNDDLSSRTEEQAASLEETAASMTQLNETIRQTAENSNIATHKAQVISQHTDENLSKVAVMAGTMSDIRVSSLKITEIISLIEGIAFQTNILALNAAVEAARAGEQGRGFAVVAGEVRNLAQSASTSAHEIKELIENSMAYVEKGVAETHEVSEKMRSMATSIHEITGLVNEISHATKEQSQGIEQINIAINQMDSVTQQNAALVEEASAAAKTLLEQSINMDSLVSVFTFKELEKKPAQNKIFQKEIAVVNKIQRLDESGWEEF